MRDVIEDDEPVEPVSVESFCATLRELIGALRASQPEDMPPGIVTDTIKSFERTLSALEPSSNQEPNHAHHP